MLTVADTTIKLPAICAKVGEVEDSVNSFFQNSPDTSIIHIDMTDVDYITAPSLIYLIALTNTLLAKKIEVKYYLPYNRDIRNIMRIWRFAIVLKEATGRGFASFVRPNDIQYFGENSLNGDYYDRFTTDEGLAELVKKDFFSITSIPFKNDDDKSLAIDGQHRKWSEDIIKSILKRHLSKYDGENEDIIPNRIIYECMTNAFRHSEAVKLITGAFFDKYGKVLTITYWDDGETIISTLEKALRENKLARVINHPNELDNNIHFTLYVKSDILDENLKPFYYSDNDPTDQDLPSEILLSAVSPGVSRDPYGKINYQSNPYLDETAKFNRPGMGLTTLLNATIDLLGGSVVIRTGDYLVSFKKPIETISNKYINSADFKHATLYQAKISKYNQNMPTFKGNMITIRLPLKK